MIKKVLILGIISVVWLLLICFLYTFVIDVTNFYSIQEFTDADTSHIRDVSEEYLSTFGITDISYPIRYNFVKFKQPVLGTFHEWNHTYFINISTDIETEDTLRSTVIHETRHLIVQHLKNQNIIDLTAYTEEIASYENDWFSRLFIDAIYLHKYKIYNK